MYFYQISRPYEDFKICFTNLWQFKWVKLTNTFVPIKKNTLDED